MQYDSFIAPAIIRGYISEVHFFCCQSEEDTEPGVDEDILSQYDCRQFFYQHPEELVATRISTPLLYDLCLDLFNKDDGKMCEGTLWSDAEILRVLEICRPLLERAAAVTVSMSFGYSGTEDQTRHLAKLVVPKSAVTYESGLTAASSGRRSLATCSASVIAAPLMPGVRRLSGSVVAFLDEDMRGGLNTALNEADLLGLELDPSRRIAAATFRVLSLPEIGDAPPDRRVQFVFRPVGRCIASPRNGRWDDEVAPVVPFDVADLLKVVQSFGALPIYGWEFFDVHATELGKWGRRASFDWSAGEDGVGHSISLFQDTSDRILDICLWFDDLEIRRPDGIAVPIEEFIDGGRRWWDAL